MVKVAFKALKGERGVDEFTDYRGIPVLAAYASIAQSPWALIAKQDKHEAFAEIDHMVRRNYFILISFLLVITLVAFLISKSIARPIKRLDEMTEKVTQGVLDVVSDIHQTDEIGRLADSFNTMTQSLKERFTRSERLSALGKLSAGLAHEIRTPLTSIKVTIQSLEKQLDLDEDQKEDFSLTKKEIDRLNENVSRFLDFARPPNPTFRSFNLNTLLQETLSLLQPKMQSNQIAVVADFCETPMLIEGDEKQLRQVFLNLILNAVEAMPSGGSLSLSTSALGEKLRQVREKPHIPEPRPEGEFAEVVISDTGMGIPSEYKSYIFDPFFTTKEGGTGLGLSIVFSIIESHHGWIDVESPPHGGTSFKVGLPIRQEKRV
jgi:signal transduction histidine kinase